MGMDMGMEWMTDEPSPYGNGYANEVIIYLETLASTAQQILPAQVLKRVLHEVLSHISGKIVGVLHGDSVRRFNVYPIMGIEVYVHLPETFTDNQPHMFSDADVSQLKLALAKLRQLMINSLLSSHPENFLDSVIKERSYYNLDYRKVVIISEKLRIPSDRLFGTFSGRGVRQNPMKSLDALTKRLKDVS
ncbi:Exocyst complex component sec15b [Thalictrum thalictroides]|uniref:Exocyst complex component sec15b n=1 Tax=Thalictrum thalictroides TaxID=46969 RepID=A0A7J6WU05_THATH|nr:Exocyst complex component sec15b [Thalictrum thalictroides]